DIVKLSGFERTEITVAERHRSPNRCAAPRRADERGQGRYAEPVRDLLRSGETALKTAFLQLAQVLRIAPVRARRRGGALRTGLVNGGALPR
ncbi:hypothetical protein ACTVZE_09410, partial [Pseudomonas aeruginosa]